MFVSSESSGPCPKCSFLPVDQCPEQTGPAGECSQENILGDTQFRYKAQLLVNGGHTGTVGIRR
jgi:hypothetical protein